MRLHEEKGAGSTVSHIPIIGRLNNKKEQKKIMSHTTKDAGVIRILIKLLNKDGIKDAEISRETGYSKQNFKRLKEGGTRNIREETFKKFIEKYPTHFKKAEKEYTKQKNKINFLTVSAGVKQVGGEFNLFMRETINKYFMIDRQGSKTKVTDSGREKWDENFDVYFKRVHDPIGAISKSTVKSILHKKKNNDTEFGDLRIALITKLYNNYSYFKESIDDYLQTHPDTFQSEKSLEEKINEIHTTIMIRDNLVKRETLLSEMIPMVEEYLKSNSKSTKDSLEKLIIKVKERYNDLK